MNHNWQELAGAVIMRAVEDYRLAVRRKSDPRYRRKALAMIRDVERFFASGWFGVLTGLNGSVLLKKLKEDAGLTPAGGDDSVSSRAGRNKRPQPWGKARIKVQGGAV